eukprot:1160255-Pelagomonas_calceolata.AAC.3
MCGQPIVQYVACVRAQPVRLSPVLAQRSELGKSTRHASWMADRPSDTLGIALLDLHLHSAQIMALWRACLHLDHTILNSQQWHAYANAILPAARSWPKIARLREQNALNCTWPHPLPPVTGFVQVLCKCATQCEGQGIRVMKKDEPTGGKLSQARTVLTQHQWKPHHAAGIKKL